MRKVSIESLQQQVHTFRCEVLEVRVLLRGGQAPPCADRLYWCPPWGLSAPVPFLIFLIVLIRLRLYPTISGLVEILPLVLTYCGGVLLPRPPVSPLPLSPLPLLLLPFPPLPPSSASSAVATNSTPPSPDPLGGSGLLSTW